MEVLMPQRAGQFHYHPNSKPNLKPPQSDELARSCIYVPPNDAPRHVLYLLHGVGNNEYSWELHGEVSRIIDDLTKAEKIPPLVVAMPFGFVRQQYKLERRFPPQAEFACHLRVFISAFEMRYGETVSAPAERALAGLSMGGRQALEFGLANPDMFRGIAGFSSAIQDRGQGDPLPDIQALIAQRHGDHTLPRLYLSCGDKDEVQGLLNANQRFKDFLEKSGIPFQWSPKPGGHEWAVWTDSLREALPTLF
jgi:enterochelin esterase-like enzyme